MNAILILFVSTAFNFGSLNSGDLDDSSYVDDSAVLEMLKVQHVKDFNSKELIVSVEDFMQNYFDKVDYVTGHFAKETNMFYYAVYGQKDGQKKVDFLEVDEKYFTNSTFYQYAAALPVGACRKGNGYPYPPVCQTLYCDIQTTNCLGIICSFYECY